MNNESVQSVLASLKKFGTCSDLDYDVKRCNDLLINNFDEYYPAFLDVYIINADNIGKDLHQLFADKVGLSRIDAKHVAMQVLSLTVPYVVATCGNDD